ncbi:MAG: hypothetical protein AAB899_03315 [Patescibacteria group bacterium]
MSTDRGPEMGNIRAKERIVRLRLPGRDCRKHSNFSEKKSGQCNNSMVGQRELFINRRKAQAAAPKFRIL